MYFHTYSHIYTHMPIYTYTLASLLSILSNSPKTKDRNDPHVLTFCL